MTAKELIHQLAEGMDSLRKLDGKPCDMHYTSTYHFVLSNGHEMSAAEDHAFDRGSVRECFKNAFNLMVGHDLTYVEGYGVTAAVPFPVLHAWNLDEQGRVIDTTWEDPSKCVYYGVPFVKEYVLRTTLDNELYGLIDRYEKNWPLLTDEKLVNNPDTWRGEIACVGM